MSTWAASQSCCGRAPVCIHRTQWAVGHCALTTCPLAIVLPLHICTAHIWKEWLPPFVFIGCPSLLLSLGSLGSGSPQVWLRPAACSGFRRVSWLLGPAAASWLARLVSASWLSGRCLAAWRCPLPSLSGGPSALESLGFFYVCRCRNTN